MSDNTIDFDGPWKSALEGYFQPFMAFFFPQAHAEIAWARGFEFLEKELQTVTRDAEIGRRVVDKLVKVWRNDGSEAWVLCHLEVQSQYDSTFPERMLVYRSRIYDLYRCEIASFAVLGEEGPNWRPTGFSQELWGSHLDFHFPIVKLLDYRQRWTELDVSPNPFATVVMAHLKALETRYDPNERQAWKLTLTRRLYERGYGRQDVLGLFRFIDWLLQLPQALETEFWQSVQQYEAQKKVTYITSVERIGIQKGTEQTWRNAIAATLEARFEDVNASAISEALTAITDIDILKILHKQSVSINSLEAFQQLLDTTGTNRD